jgi:hypothetical protein
MNSPNLFPTRQLYRNRSKLPRATLDRKKISGSLNEFTNYNTTRPEYRIQTSFKKVYRHANFDGNKSWVCHVPRQKFYAIKSSVVSGCNIETHSHFRVLTVITPLVAAPVPMIIAGVLTVPSTSLRLICADLKLLPPPIGKQVCVTNNTDSVCKFPRLYPTCNAKVT